MDKQQLRGNKLFLATSFWSFYTTEKNTKSGSSQSFLDFNLKNKIIRFAAVNLKTAS